MADPGIGGFLSGLVQGFGNTFAQNKERMRLEEQEKKEKQAKVKLFEIQLEREQRAAKADANKEESLKQLEARFVPPQIRSAESPSTMGPPAPQQGAPPSLASMMADPQVLMLMQRAGVDPDKFMPKSAGGISPEVMKIIQGGQGGMGGMDLTGVKLDSSGRPMLDFERRKVSRTATDATGREMVQYDQFGKEIGRVPAAPSERAEEDKPLSPTELLNFPGSKPGMSMRQVRELGLKPTRQISPEQAGRMQSLKGATDLAMKIKGTYIKEDGTIDRKAVFSAFTNAPGTTGRKTSAQFEDALDAVIRARTGAAVTKEELESTVRQFKPSPLDDDATILDKMERLNSFVSGASALASPGQKKVVSFAELPD